MMQLELGTLEEQKKEASASCGHGVGADTGLTKEQAMTLEIFAKRLLRNISPNEESNGISATLTAC